MADVQLKPEQKVRAAIDEIPEAGSWAIQDYKAAAIDLEASRGLAHREFPTKHGPFDCLRLVDGKVIRSIEATKEDSPLIGAGARTERNMQGFADVFDKGGAPPH